MLQTLIDEAFGHVNELFVGLVGEGLVSEHPGQVCADADKVLDRDAESPGQGEERVRACVPPPSRLHLRNGTPTDARSGSEGFPTPTQPLSGGADAVTYVRLIALAHPASLLRLTR